MISRTTDVLSDSVFSLRGIRVLLTILADNTNDHEKRYVLDLLAKDVALVESKIDILLRYQSREKEQDNKHREDKTSGTFFRYSIIPAG